MGKEFQTRKDATRVHCDQVQGFFPGARTEGRRLWLLGSQYGKGKNRMKGRMEPKLPSTYRCAPGLSVTFAGAWVVGQLGTWALKS